MAVVSPTSYEEAAGGLRAASDAGRRVRFRGAGTKLGWGNPVPEPDVEISTARLDCIVEHNAGDLTAVVQAGVPLARLQEELAAHGQMLALDPPLGDGDAATIGGVLATGDSGPLRHRYGGPRDLVLGMTVALSDGTIARSGGKVIKNVAGYDLAKLFCGSFGTLGMILEVAVRLHPLPRRTVTVAGRSTEPEAIGRAASALAHSRLEAQCLDVEWSAGHGSVLARFGGIEAQSQAEEAAALLEAEGLTAGTNDDDAWDVQRRRQRSAAGCVLRVSGTQSELAAQVRGAEDADASLVGRAAHGLSWIATDEAGGDTVMRLRSALAPARCAVLDAPAAVRSEIDAWDPPAPGAVELMRRVKERFDPGGVCNRGAFVGAI